MSLADESPERAGTRVSARTVAIMAVFIALSAVGALIRIPSPTGTVACDAAAGFFVALAFGAWPGFIVIALGHLLTAGLAGFPYTLPLHLGIAVAMGVCALLLRWIGRRGGLVWLIIGSVVTVVANALLAPLVLLPSAGTGAYIALIPSLLVGAVINVAIAVIAWWALRSTRLVS